MSKEKNKSEPNLADVERLVFETMRHCGMIPPMTVAEVEQIEAQLGNIELPFSPRDPRELLRTLDIGDRDMSRDRTPLHKLNTEAEHNLAQAAREGGEISEEVARRMAEDKLKSQQHDYGKR